MGNASDVLIGADGAVSRAPLGTVLPTTVSGTPNAAFNDLGFVSDAGVTEHNGTSTTNIKNWKGDIVRTVQTEHDLTYKLVLIETTENTEETYYNGDPSDGIEGVAGIRESWIIDVFDGNDQVRIVIPDGQVTDRGDVIYKNDQAIAYEVTITCYPDDDSKKAYKYRTAGS